MFFGKRTKLDIRWPWVWVQTVALTLCMALGRSLNLSVLLLIYKMHMLKPSIWYRHSINVCWMKEQMNKHMFYSCGEKSIQRLRDFYNFCGIAMEISGQVQKWRLLKEPFLAIYILLRSPLQCLVAGCLSAVASEARPRLCENLYRLPCK